MLFKKFRGVVYKILALTAKGLDKFISKSFRKLRSPVHSLIRRNYPYFLDEYILSEFRFSIFITGFLLSPANLIIFFVV